MMHSAGVSSVRLEKELVVCSKCGLAARVGRGLCLNCLLYEGFGPDTCDDENLAAVLEEVDVHDADWHLGNYQILDEIGRGGMGVIYRARQRHSRRIVALKRILAYHADSRETLMRFRREAEAAASLDHPNILPIYEVSESDDGMPFFSMKFAAGGSLLDAQTALLGQPRRSVALVAKVARAVQYAHSQGILHRDLKPGNVLLDARGEALVSDFGLAKWLDTTSDLTRTLTIFGTPGYIAPEQANGPAASLKPTADVYSLGAILFDLLAGRPPFLGEHAFSVIQQAAARPAPKLRSIVANLDRDLETICARCLEREPTARYRSADALAEDLDRWLDNRPIIARPVSVAVRAWRWSKRNPKLAASIGVCVLVSAAAGVWQIQGQHLKSAVHEQELAARSIVILPFLNLDTAQPDETVSRLVASALQNDLSRLGPVRIVPAARSEAWRAGTDNGQDIKEANSSAKARTAIAGTERVVNRKIHLSLRMMNAATGEVLLTRFLDIDSPATLPAGLRTSVLSDIHSILNSKDLSTVATATRDPGLRNPQSHDFIIAGRQLMFRDTMEDYDRSTRCLEKAVEIEPNSAVAHAYLSSTLASRAHFAVDSQLLGRAEKEAREAVRLEPDSPEARRALAGIYFLKNDLVSALEEELRVIELGGPEERVAAFMGMTLITLGQPQRALGWLAMANHFASLPASYDALIGDCWTLLADDERAEAAYRRAMELRPEVPDGSVGLCHLRLLKDGPAEAREFYQQTVERFNAYQGTSDNQPTALLAQIEFFARNYQEAERLYSSLAKDTSTGGSNSYGAMTYSSVMARLKQCLHDNTGSRTLLQQCLANEKSDPTKATKPATLYRIAAIEACLGNSKAALESFRAAAAAGWLDYRSAQLDPRFDAINSTPEFKAIISSLTTTVAQIRRQTGQPVKMAQTGD